MMNDENVYFPIGTFFQFLLISALIKKLLVNNSSISGAMKINPMSLDIRKKEFRGLYSME